MPLGCVIYLPKLYRLANGVPHYWNYRCSEVLYIHTAWGFGVARFYRMGDSQVPHGVKRATGSGFTSFLFYINWPSEVHWL